MAMFGAICIFIIYMIIYLGCICNLNDHHEKGNETGFSVLFLITILLTLPLGYAFITTLFRLLGR